MAIFSDKCNYWLSPVIGCLKCNYSWDSQTEQCFDKWHRAITFALQGN